MAVKIRKAPKYISPSEIINQRNTGKNKNTTRNERDNYSPD